MERPIVKPHFLVVKCGAYVTIDVASSFGEQGIYPYLKQIRLLNNLDMVCSAVSIQIDSFHAIYRSARRDQKDVTSHHADPA